MKKQIYSFISHLFKVLLQLLPPIFLLVLIAIVYSKLGFENFLRLLDVIVWPCVLLVSVIFFRKVFFYLFLSMEEFNFFGAKGMLKNVGEVIDERVKKIKEKEEKEAQDKQEREKLRSELEHTKVKGINTEATYKDATDRLFAIADGLINSNQDLAKRILEKDELIKQYEAKEEALKYQNEALKNIVTFGSTSPVSGTYFPPASPSPSEEVKLNAKINV